VRAAQLVSGAQAAPAGRHAGPIASTVAGAGSACPAGAATLQASAPAPVAAAAAVSVTAAGEPATSADTQARRGGGSPGAACAPPAAGPGGAEADGGAAPAPGAGAAADPGADPVGNPPAPWPELRYRDAAALARGLRAALGAYSEAGGEELLVEEGAAAALAALRDLADQHDAVAQGARSWLARPPRAASVADPPVSDAALVSCARPLCKIAVHGRRRWASSRHIAVRAVQRRAVACCMAAPRVLRGARPDAAPAERTRGVRAQRRWTQISRPCWTASRTIPARPPRARWPTACSSAWPTWRPRTARSWSTEPAGRRGLRAAHGERAPGGGSRNRAGPAR